MASALRQAADAASLARAAGSRRDCALLAHAVRTRRTVAHLRALGVGLRLVPGVLRDRPHPAVPIARVVPAQPIRGRHAEGHRSGIAASWRGVGDNQPTA